MISDCPGPERLMLMGYNALKDLLDEHLHVDVNDRDRVRTILRGLSMTAIEVLGNMEQAWAKEGGCICLGSGSHCICLGSGPDRCVLKFDHLGPCKNRQGADLRYYGAM